MMMNKNVIGLMIEFSRLDREQCCDMRWILKTEIKNLRNLVFDLGFRCGKLKKD